MRVSLNSFAIVALLGSVPFASVVRSYPTGYIDVVETSKRGFGSPRPPPSNPFRDPSHSPPLSNPFRDPSTSPSLPGSPARPAAVWRNFADADLKLADPAKDAMRIKGQGYITDLDTAISMKSASKKIESLKAKGYEGQAEFEEQPRLKIPLKFDLFKEWGINIRSNWLMDDIRKLGSNTIVKTYESPKQKAMITSKSYNNAQDPEGQLTWTDMVMSNWHNAATRDTDPVSDLKYIVRNHIQMGSTRTRNGLLLDTRAAMQDAFTAMDKKTSETLTLDFNTANKVEMQQVSILSAQTHVARVLQMLKDYRDEFKDLKITKLHLQHGENPQSDSQYNIIIELGR